MSNRRAAIRILLVVTVAMALAGPAMASDTPAHAKDQVLAIRDQGLADMDGVVAAFQIAIASLDNVAAADEAETAAKSEIEVIWIAARTVIDDLLVLYPGPLAKVAKDAKQDLQSRRNSARAEIGDIADAWAPPAAPTTTTTTLPAATTTTVAATTSTTSARQVTTPPGSGNGGGSSGNGNGNGSSDNTSGNGSSGNGTSGSGTGSTVTGGNGSSGSDSRATAVPDRVGAVETSTSATPDSSAIIDQLAIALPAFTPEQGEIVMTASTPTPVEPGPAVATEKMSAVLDTVLPPAVVDLVLSPLMVLEILFRTTVDDGGRVLAPLALLALSAIAIAVGDRLTRRQTAI